jgi:16S rRNA (adenine1518-N6/adenine1519-N6)-dimethyltransferase
MNSDKFKEIFKPQAPKPNKLLGQHFLHDKNVLARIIEAANLTKDDIVLEVGPGLGVLTRELAKHAGRVVAVEKDRSLAEILTGQLAEEKIDNVEIVANDILEFLKTTNHQLTTNYKVVANIPYYLTSHLIRLLLESENPPRDIVLLIQKEVARRICAKPPEMSLLAVSVQFYAESKIIASVSRKSFRPEPKVDSAIIRITPRLKSSPTLPKGRGQNSPPLGGVRGDFNPLHFFHILHAGFSHPRKQLLGNLSKELKIAKEEIEKALTDADIKNSQRAETLTVEDWIRISNRLDFKAP